MVLTAVVPECTVATFPYPYRTTPLKVLAAKLTSAPSQTPTYPPFSSIAVTVPPLETYIRPP